MNYPPIVSREEWRAQRDALMLEEKAHTRATDALAARRRQLPMMEITKAYVFDAPDGRKLSLLELFEGRDQLILYFHMLKAGSDHVCPGCSHFSDNLGRFEHLNARRTTFAVASAATLEQIAQVRQRMEYSFPWYSSLGNTFYEDIIAPQGMPFGLEVFIRQGERVFLTYYTHGRGVETTSNTFGLLDITPWGRQEDWQQAPAGTPQEPTYSWLRLHDQY